MRITVWHNGEAVGRVKYNANLDIWDGGNWQNGGVGRHLGVTKLRNPVDGLRFVLIHGTQWEGERDWAELVPDEVAKQEILAAGKEDLLKRFFPGENFDLEA